jgi:hypothetical protein
MRKNKETSYGYIDQEKHSIENLSYFFKKQTRAAALGRIGTTPRARGALRVPAMAMSKRKREDDGSHDPRGHDNRHSHHDHWSNAHRDGGQRRNRSAGAPVPFQPQYLPKRLKAPVDSARPQVDEHTLTRDQVVKLFNCQPEELEADREYRDLDGCVYCYNREATSLIGGETKYVFRVYTRLHAEGPG